MLCKICTYNYITGSLYIDVEITGEQMLNPIFSVANVLKLIVCTDVSTVHITYLCEQN